MVYDITFSNENDNNSEITAVKKDSLGKSVEAITNIGIAVSPNPSDSNMNVVYEIPESETRIFEIYNLIGKKLLRYPLYGGKNTFNISATSLNEGIYFYRATAGNKLIATDKIVVIK